MILAAVYLVVGEPLVGQHSHPARTELFRDDIVATIQITIAEDDIATILDPDNSDAKDSYPAMMIFDNGTVRDTVESVGFRLRGNTSRNANKKSFKVDLNAFVPGQTFYGVQEINLNGQHNDPSSSRAKICADIAEMIGIPSMRSNHVELYINDEYRGLYTNVEHIDQLFVRSRFGNQNGNLYKCLYPADLDYKGDNPDVYKEVIYGRRKYDLRTNKDVDDYSDFSEFIKVLNLTPIEDLPCELEKVFNVDQYIKTIAFDVLTGNWDGPIYNQNNFYLYHNLDTDLFEYIPYDLDNTLGIDWVQRDWANRNINSWSKTDAIRPIYNRIMAVPEYQARYQYYMSNMVFDHFNESTLYPYFEDMRDLLKPSIEDDLYYRMDYGFDPQKFEDSWEIDVPSFQVDYSLKDFVQTRLISALNQMGDQFLRAVITEIEPQPTCADQALSVSCNIFASIPISSVELCVMHQGETRCAEMDSLGAEVYSGEVSVEGFSGMSGYFIRVGHFGDGIETAPVCDVFDYWINDEEPQLAINEVMAINNSTIADEEGEFDDWVELYNYGSDPINLVTIYLSDNPDRPNKWNLPNEILQAGEYFLIWLDNDPQQGARHATFKLNGDGETLGLYQNCQEEPQLIDEVVFEEQIADVAYGRLPNGDGPFVKLVPTPGSQNLEISTSVEDSMIDIVVSPNPSGGISYIETAGLQVERVEVYNLKGQQIDAGSSRSSIDLTSENPGLYFVQVVLSSGQVVNRKLIKN